MPLAESPASIGRVLPSAPFSGSCQAKFSKSFESVRIRPRSTRNRHGASRRIVLGDYDCLGYPSASKSRPSRAQSQRQAGHHKAEQGDAFSLPFNHGVRPFVSWAKSCSRAKRNRIKPVTQASRLLRQAGFQPEAAAERARCPHDNTAKMAGCVTPLLFLASVSS